jgi:hypothetical protein
MVALAKHVDNGVAGLLAAFAAVVSVQAVLLHLARARLMGAFRFIHSPLREA